MSRKIVRTTSVLSFFVGLCLPFSISAVEQSPIQSTKFSLTMYSAAQPQVMQVKTIEPLANKPFIQLMQLSLADKKPVSKDEGHLDMFSMAMQVQDKMHYYMDVLESTFSSSSKKDYEPEECQPRGFANVAKFFSF